MSIWHEELETSRLVGLRGRLDHRLTPDLERVLQAQLDAGHTRLVVDLSAVNYINSGGLRCLLSGWRRAQQGGGDLVLCGLNGRLIEIFNMVGFDNIFTIYPSRESANLAWQT